MSLGIGIAGLVAGTIMIAVGGPSVVYETPPRTGQRRWREPRLHGASFWGAPLGGEGGVVGVRGAF